MCSLSCSPNMFITFFTLTALTLLLPAAGKLNIYTTNQQFCLPRRVFCPVKATSPLCVCDYQFSDEGLSEMTDRFKEMLDIEATEADLDITQELIAEVIESDAKEESLTEEAKPPHPWRNNYIGVAMATAVALLASAASMLYLSDA